MVRTFFPIDRERYDLVMEKQAEHRKNVRDALGVPAAHSVLLNVGKLAPWKQQSDLVRLSNRIQAERSDVTVILAGSGSEEAALRKLCRRTGPGGVLFAGFVSPATLAGYYCAADVYVQSSAQEHHSLAVSEAVYCGLPVLITDRCGSYGPSDEVRHGLNGFVYRCGDIEELRRRALVLLDEPELRETMGRASRAIGLMSQQLAHGAALDQSLAILSNDAMILTPVEPRSHTPKVSSAATEVTSA
jgi:glycosyltransferase involved in cell wall biosynthesis